MFSATFKRKVERLARDILSDPVRVVQGDIGEANEDVTQHVQVFKKREDKWPWLSQRLVEFTSQGAVLIFVTRKDNSEELASKLKTIDTKCRDQNMYFRNNFLRTQLGKMNLIYSPVLYAMATMCHLLLTAAVVIGNWAQAS